MLKDEENIKNNSDNIEDKIETEETEIKNEEESKEASGDTKPLEEDELETESEETNAKSGRFIAKLGANIIDQGISLIISFGLLYLLNVILIPFGYKVGDKVLTFLVIYVIVNILYSIIVEATKLKKTIGKSILKL